MRLFIDFVPVLLWALLAVALVVLMLLGSWVLRPHVLQNSEKTATYECGQDPIGPARISFPYSYIAYALLFLVVDVMGAFLWIYAASSLRTSETVVWQMILFMFFIMAGIAFLLKILPQAQLDGKETLELYREAIAKRQVTHKRGSH